MRNHYSIGPLRIRVGGKNLSPWGFPRVQIGGLTLWSRTNTGELHLAAYHPKSSITWIWYVGLTRRARGYSPLFSREERRRLAVLFVTGNPYVGPDRWYHSFWQPSYRRVGQWHDYLRLPFGWALVIGRQNRMSRGQS